MKLTQLMQPWVTQQLPECELLGLHNDSRQINPGFLFFAYPGAAADGRFYIKQAINAGAIAIVYEPTQWPANCQLPCDIPCIALPDLANKLAEIASRFYEEPSKKLRVTGVTGTNGKTTIAYQLAQAHALLGAKSTYIGTIGQGDVTALQSLANTTPDALCLQQLFHDYVENSVQQVCMEVSSHALAQGRVNCIDFHQAIFTNLSHEHLDYHQNMENYAATKARLFAKPTLKWAIINQDDAYSRLMHGSADSCQTIGYGINEGAEVRALQWDVSLEGTRITLSSPWGRHELLFNALGFFNIYNTLAVFTSLLLSDYPVESVVAAITKLKAAPGRMEIVSHEPYIIVDYAHSPDALENVLSTLQKVKKGRIIVVFGCGGDRDKTKRPLMGKIASQYADITIITSDNPRTENPDQIIAAIESGVVVKPNLYKIADRRQAIAKAINIANKNDIILVAGKGHEAYQQIGNVRHDFSDQAVIRTLYSEQKSCLLR